WSRGCTDIDELRTENPVSQPGHGATAAHARSRDDLGTLRTAVLPDRRAPTAAGSSHPRPVADAVGRSRHHDALGPLTNPARGMMTNQIGPVTVGPVAHGGHCVARHDGRVVFVRHALPGESVTVRLTDTTHDAYWRGDAVAVHRASPHRVAAPCPISGPGGCGGCDLQHVAPAHQAEWKRQVVAEQLQHPAGIDWEGAGEPGTPRPAEGGWPARARPLGGPRGRGGPPR